MSDKHGSGQEGQPRELRSWVIIEMKKETNVQIERERVTESLTSVAGFFFFFFFSVKFQ